LRSSPRGTLTVEVGFTPNSKGKVPPGSLDITVQSPSSGNATVTLRGIGTKVVAPQIPGPVGVR